MTIREYSSTLYVGLARAVSPIDRRFMTLSVKRYPENEVVGVTKWKDGFINETETAE